MNRKHDKRCEEGMLSSMYLPESLTFSAALRAFKHLASFSNAFGNAFTIAVPSPSATASAAVAASLAASSASSAVQVIGNYSMRICVRKEFTVTNRNNTKRYRGKIKHLPIIAAASAEASAAVTPSAAIAAAFATPSATVAVRLREEKKY